MSLFKIRDWWNTCNEEQFGAYSLCIANIDNDINQSDKLILGSQNGILRVYTVAYSEENYLRSYQPNDLLIEVDLKHPILQVSTGLLFSANKDIHLAVLHPRKVSIYSFAVTTGLADYGCSYNISLVYEHNLLKSAYNLVLGPFGHIKGKDFICVQSLDGTLSFFEQESFAFSRFLTNFLLPGPIAYISTSDSFIVSSSSWSIESYRYQVLAISKNDSSSPDASNKVQKVYPDWSLQIGEPAIDIQTHVIDRKSFQIIVLGEKNLFIIKENGIMICMKKFDFSPISMFSYLNDNYDSIIILIATSINTLLIFSNQILKWSSKLPFTPIAISRANFKMLKGALIFLSEDGQLCSSYLGTNPSPNVVAIKSSEGANVSFQKMEKELTELRKIINNFNTDETFLISNVSSDNKKWSTSDLIVTHSKPIWSLNKKKKTNLDLDRNESISLATFSLNLESIVEITNIRVNLQASSAFVINPNILYFANLPENGQKVTSLIQVTFLQSFLPSSLELTIVIIYSNIQNASKILQKIIQLPLSLIAETSRFQKEAPISLNFDVVSSKSVDLMKIFSDLIKVSSFEFIENQISISFRTQGSYFVIISISSRNQKQKFRIKSNTFEGFSIIVTYLLNKLKRENFQDMEIDINSLSIDLYFDLISDHLTMRKKLLNSVKSLSQLSAQFRAVEKRFLVKLKDRKPSPLCNLNLLLETLNSQIISMINQIIDLEKSFEVKSNGLSAATKFMSTLLMIGAKSKQEFSLIENAFSTDIFSDINEGWEERTEIALMNILKYKIKNQMTEARLLNHQLSIPDNIENLKELINEVFNQVFSTQTTRSTNINNHNNKKDIHSANEIIFKEDQTDFEDQLEKNNEKII